MKEIKKRFAEIGARERKAELCARCTITKIDRAKKTICEDCVTKLVEDFQRSRSWIRVYA